MKSLKNTIAMSMMILASLAARGVASSRISTDAKGDTVQPFDTVEKNRVSICVATPTD